MTPKLTPCSSITDEQLWASFRHGDKQALENIYRTYSKVLFVYGMKIKRNRSLVKDCIQELFVELWKSRSRLSATNNIKFYLLKALKLKMHHQLKKESYLDTITEEADYTSPLSISVSYEDSLIEAQTCQENRQKIRSMVRQLPNRQREIIHLLFFEGLSYEEISSIMHIHTQSVYTLVWKALSSLKKQFSTLLFFLLVNCLL